MRRVIWGNNAKPSRALMSRTGKAEELERIIYSSQTWKTKEMLIMPWYFCPSLGAVLRADTGVEEGGGRLCTQLSLCFFKALSAPREQTHPSLPMAIIGVGHSPCAAEAQQKLPGGFAALVDAGTISLCSPQSMRWHKSFQECWKTNQSPQGLFFI